MTIFRKLFFGVLFCGPLCRKAFYISFARCFTLFGLRLEQSTYVLVLPLCFHLYFTEYSYMVHLLIKYHAIKNGFLETVSTRANYNLLEIQIPKLYKNIICGNFQSKLSFLETKAVNYLST